MTHPQVPGFHPKGEVLPVPGVDHLGALPAEQEGPVEDIRNALTMLQLCATPTVGPHDGANYQVYRGEDIQAIAARLTTAMAKLG